MKSAEVTNWQAATLVLSLVLIPFVLGAVGIFFYYEESVIPKIRAEHVKSLRETRFLVGEECNEFMGSEACHTICEVRIHE